MKACFHTTLEWRTEKRIPETFKGPFLIWTGKEFEIILTVELLAAAMKAETFKKWTLLPRMEY